VQHINPPVSETTTSNVNKDTMSVPLQETKAAVSTNTSESDGPNNTENVPVILHSAEEKLATPKDNLSQSADSDVKAKRDGIDEISVQKRNQAENISTTLGDETPNQSLCEEGTPKRLTLTHPMRPEGLPSKIADTIADGKFYDACILRKANPSIPKESLVEFLLSLSRATPIPETLISNLLVQTMDTKSFRVKLRSFIGIDVAASDARDVVIAAIKVWLWTEHEESFQKAFVANKKIESDSDCTWLLKVSVRKSVFALSRVYGEEDLFKKSVPKSEIATIVSQALANKVVVDSNMSLSLPMLGNLVSLLDSLRMEALKAKTQERVLLAALLSRRYNVSEAFSDAYVSSVIRAGEALGHEEVCEIVQDEECRASTMLPYDFFCDHRGVWEEPCRPPTGYHPDVTADELVKRAHARAAFQKSMKKLQTRLGLRGGVSDGGPYCPVTPSSTPAPSPTAAHTPNPAILYRSTSSTLKRKGSQILGETSLVIGAGATGLPDSLLNPPSHLSTPLTWDMNNSSNLPYGRHNTGDRPGIVSVGGPSFMDIKRRKTSHAPNYNKNTSSEGNKFTHKYRSTLEIEWGDVAKMFLSGGSRRNIFGKPGDMGIANLKDKGTIIAPFIKEFDFDSFASRQQEKEELISSDEDISDETVFRRHQEVLDGMKRKLDAALQKRQQQPPFQRTRKR